MGKKVMVLGCGRVGSFLAWELSRDDFWEVTVADRDAEPYQELASRAGSRIGRFRAVDFSSPGDLAQALKGQDLAIGAAPGFLGYRVMEAVLEAGIPFCDISFLPEDFRRLDPAARAKGIPVLADIGVAPGLANLLVAYGCGLLDQADSAVYYVTGLPAKPEPPFHYRLVFSPDDVIEEYVRPARIRKGGAIRTVPALDGCHPIRFPGTPLEGIALEAFHTDGLRSLLETIPVPDLAEYTLRYPGTAGQMAFLRDIGLLSRDPVLLSGQPVVPRELFGALAYPKMRLMPGEPEFTFLQVEVHGRQHGEPCRHCFTLYDAGDPVAGFHSMARATGLPCLVAARMIAEKKWYKPGVHPPEDLGFDRETATCFLEEMSRKGLAVHHQVRNGSR